MKLWRTYLGLTLSAVFWGASFVASKIVLRVLSPAALTVARFGIGFVVIWLIVGPKTAMQSFNRKEVPIFIVLGFFGITLHQWLQATGLKTAQATTGAWMVSTIPIYVALLSKLVLGERLGRRRSMGIFIAATGAFVVLIRGKVGGIQQVHVGDVLFVLSALNWAIFSVISRKTLLGVEEERGRGPNLTPAREGQRSMLLVMGFGWLLSLAWLAGDGGWTGYAQLDGEALRALLFLGIASSGLAYIFWYSGLQKIDAVQAGAFLYIEPFVTMLIAWPLLGERMTISALLGGFAIVSGVVLINRS